MCPQQSPNNMSNSSTNCFLTYTKLRFFNRIRRFLQLKTSRRKTRVSTSSSNRQREITMEKAQDCKRERELEEDEGLGGVERVSDEAIVGSFVALQKSVKRLHFGSWEEKIWAAEHIRRIAGEDLKTRKAVAELGVVPPLVAMAGSEVAERRMVAIRTLIELADGTYTNKVLMLEAGIVSNLPGYISILQEPERQTYAKLLLYVSSLANSQYALTSFKILPILLSILESDSTFDTKELCLGAIHNFSTMLENTTHLISNGLVTTLLRLSSVKQTSEKALATLANLVVTVMGKMAIENDESVPENLIEIMTWEENPKCQELSAYVLMILAHQSSEQRQKMAKAGIVPVLLEVALLGSPLAQKRAMKLLQWFKDERKTKMGPHSGPQTGRTIVSMNSLANRRETDEGTTLMKQIVRQSLYKNMETIARRASRGDGNNENYDNIKALIISTSSKSLPY